MKEGIQWRVEDGRNVRILSDPWLPTPRTFKPLSRHIDMPSMVSNIVTPNAKWDKPTIEMCFCPEEAGIILGMPFSQHGCPDRLIWHYTRNGMYSVQSGYLVAQEMNRNGELGVEGCWAVKYGRYQGFDMVGIMAFGGSSQALPFYLEGV